MSASDSLPSLASSNRCLLSDERDKKEREYGGRGSGTEISKKLEMTFVAVQEPFWLIAAQVFLPYIIAGIGMVGAGTVLNVVKVNAVYILVSVLSQI